MLMTQGEKKRMRLLCLKCVDEFSASMGAEHREHQQRLQEPDACCGQGDSAAQTLLFTASVPVLRWGGGGVISSPSVVRRSGYAL